MTSQQPETAAISTTSAWRIQLATIRQQAHAWWLVRTARERRLLRTAGIAVGAGLVWSLGMQPALNTIAQSREQLPHLRAQAAQVEALIAESQALAGTQAGKIDAADLPEALRASLQRAGLGASSVVDDAITGKDTAPPGWKINFTNADAAHVMQWLAALPYSLRVQTKAVTLTRSTIAGRDRPGRVTGRIRIGLPAERMK